MSTATGHRLPRPRLPHGLRRRRPRLGRRGLAALVVLVGLLVGAFFWVRSSSLFVVQQVRVTGVSGLDATAIRRALVQTAEGMSTLDVDRGRLEAAVRPYRIVRGLALHTHLPHGLTIGVSERIPVAQLSAGGETVTVASDGELMRGYRARTALPVIDVVAIPAGARATGGAARLVTLLGAAPYPMLAHVASARVTAHLGLAIVLRDGPVVYFGSATELGAKWQALIDTLADPDSKGASYLDVTDPRAVAAGSGTDMTPNAGETPATSTTATTSVSTVTSTSSTG